MAASVANDPRTSGTRASHVWISLAAGLFFLIVVLVFILQNLKSVRVHIFWATWTVPLAVDLLLATILGGLVMFAAGSLRILQLRRVARRQASAALGRASAAGPSSTSGADVAGADGGGADVAGADSAGADSTGAGGPVGGSSALRSP